MSDLTGIILAGGQSRRMARDKSLMTLGGRTLVQRAVDALTPICADIVLVTNTPDKYDFPDLLKVPDAFPGTGSLGGLYSGLSAAGAERAIAVACDMPFLHTALLAYLAELLADADAVVPNLSESGAPGAHAPGAKAKQIDFHPLHAAYRRECLAPIEAQLRAGDLRMIGFLSHVRLRTVERADIQRLDPQLHSFFNVNTPEEWAIAEQIAAGGAA
ncbi:MAG: molybdenum cofactor guanylyltransferase [Chloroflexi bacterium]|nr:molybdenum cofactor guanylyltransferase [Chloroflexota bacterium]MBI3733241.1 molybdenum cofactor guanylyltransferase [Chloroflexota bacterium]